MQFPIINERETLLPPKKSRFGEWRLKMALEDFIQSYRKKLGSYDIKPWEQAMEASVRHKQTLSEIQKRPTKLKPELIDVDLVRGSTYPKEKSQFAWTFFTRDSISRVVCLPFQSEWWIEQTSESVFYLLIILYFLQLFSLLLWSFNISSPERDEEWMSASETLSPLLLMFIISEILTQAERHDHAPHPSLVCESTSDDASIDFDDLASLSDRSCRSSSPGDGSVERSQRYSFSSKTRRKTKRRPSRSTGSTGSTGYVNGNGSDEVVHWKTKGSEEVFEGEDPCRLQEKVSVGFFGFRPKRVSLKGDETTDSGLFEVSQTVAEVSPTKGVLRQRVKGRNSLPRIEDSEQLMQHPVLEDDDLESDVSDMELNGWKAGVNKVHDESTSDKEATDEDTLLQAAPRVAVPPSTPLTDDDDILPEREPVRSVAEQPIGCTMWESRSFSFHKADLTVYEITNCIVRSAENSRQVPVTGSSRFALALLPLVFALLPVCHGVFKTFHPSVGGVGGGVGGRRTSLSGLMRLEGTWTDWSLVVFKANGIVQRYFWGFWFFLLLAVAFETYQQRYLVAKYFGYLTSSRRAKRANLPHFRLSKVRNVKSWLCVRSCLKKYGPRKSVDVVVSFSCLSCLICVIFTCFMVVNAEDQFTSSIYVWEAMLWLFAVGLFLLRFMVLGSKTNQKFRNSSILTTEQLNLYLRMEQKPHKKEQLMLVNNVLKLAADLIKEIEHPCKISGFPANPFLYNISRLLILSAFSTLISEICGFKLKLYKLKM